MRRALIALVALAACAAPAPQTLEGRQLDGTYWVLRDPDLHPQTAPTLRFVGARADGFAGCNRWSARITQANGGLRFEDISATEMACPGRAMEVERQFLERLPQVRAAEYDASLMALRLTGTEAEELFRFEAWQPPAQRAR